MCGAYEFTHYEMQRVTRTKQRKQAVNMVRKTQEVDNRVVRSRGVGMPRQFRTTLRFAYNGTVAVTGVNQGIAFGCNTPNQPNRTVGTTETPAYYTKLAALYDRVYTNASKITVRVVNVTVADGTQLVLSNDGNSSVPTNIFDSMERTGAQSGILGHYQGGDSQVCFEHQWTPKPFIGVPPDSPDNTVVAADPPNPYFWFVSLQTLGGGTGNVVFQVVVEYDVTFHELTLPY